MHGTEKSRTQVMGLVIFMPSPYGKSQIIIIFDMVLYIL